MAKKSKIAREHKVIKNVQKYAALRAELKDIIKSPKSASEDKRAAVAKLTFSLIFWYCLFKSINLIIASYNSYSYIYL